MDKLTRGLFGDWKEVDGIYELRLDFGPGYRIYYGKRGNVIVVLIGGDKGTQKKDISTARKWWKEHQDEINEL